MGLRIDFDVFGEDKVSYDLLGFSERAGDMGPGLRMVAQVLREQISERFDAEGPGWRPLAPSTIAQKAAAGQDLRILHRTLALRDSLTTRGSGNVEIVSDDSLLFGSSVPYGGKLQSDPGRKVVDFSPARRQEHVRVLQRFLVEGDLVDARALA